MTSQILAVLKTDCGRTVKDIAKDIPRFGHNNRTHSGAVRSWLIQLEKMGRVKKMDNLKPVCWMKVI